MSDIRKVILNKYDVDISRTDLLKLYRIDRADLSPARLQEKIDACRKRWQTSANLPNEALAQKARAHLEQADRYEAVLKDPELLRKLLEAKQAGGAAEDALEDAEHTREFFSLVKTTKTLTPHDGELYCDWYGLKGKQKSAVRELLKKEFNVNVPSGFGAGRKKEQAEEDEQETPPETAGKGDAGKHGALIVNLFSGSTVRLIGKCLRTFDEAKQLPELVKHFPVLEKTLYEAFISGDRMTYGAFRDAVEQGRKASQDIYKDFEMGDGQKKRMNVLYNDMQKLSQSKDVIDNFEEFKLLLRYPELTPLMYEFVEMKPKTMNGLYDVASREYSFRDETDFVLNYYEHVYDNFNINNNAIKDILKKAKKSAAGNRFVNAMDKALGIKGGVRLGPAAAILHYFAYLPVYLFYVIFEIVKLLLNLVLKKPFRLLLLAGLLFAANYFLPAVYGRESLLYFRNVFQDGWREILGSHFPGQVTNRFGVAGLTLILFVLQAAIYVVPAALVYLFIVESAKEMTKRMDLRGLERTCEKLSENLKRRTKTDLRNAKGKTIARLLGTALANVLFVLLILSAVFLIRIAILNRGIF